MKYNEETYNNIKNRILSNMSNELDKREGSIINDMVSPISAEFAKNYIQLDAVIDLFFLKNLEKEDLEKRANDYGLIRKEAQYASGYVRIYGENGIKITNEMGVYTDNGLKYKVVIETEDGFALIENGYTDVYVVAENVGKIYNAQAGSIKNIEPANEKVSNVSNMKEFIGGADEETDEELLDRFKDYLSNPITSGNEAYYKQKILEIPGINGVTLIPKWNGPGTLKIIIYYDNKPVDIDTLNEAKKVIDEARVVDANITVITPEQLSVNVSAHIEIDSSFTIEQVIKQFRENLNEYIEKCKNKIIFHKVVSCLSIIDAVEDFSELLLNSSTSNIIYTDESRPYINKVILNGYEG